MEEYTEMANMEQTTKAPRTAEELLALAKSLIADDLLTPRQLDLAENSPYDFLRVLAGPDETKEQADRVHDLVREVERALVCGYFQSLLAKAAEGEKFDEARLQKALVKGQVLAVEALTAALSDSSTLVSEKVRIAEVLKS